jgi:hypothetical protein
MRLYEQDLADLKEERVQREKLLRELQSNLLKGISLAFHDLSSISFLSKQLGLAEKRSDGFSRPSMTTISQKC